MVMRKLILFFLLLPTFLSAQQALNQTYVDSLSYAYFTQFEYGNLEQLGKKSLQEGIDFFYLRLRLGIVAFKQENYEKAWPHFVKAEALLPGDPVVLEYLYWSYRYTGQNDKANGLFEKYKYIVSEFLPGLINTSQTELELGYIYTNNFNNYATKSLVPTDKNSSGGSFFSSMNYARLYQENRFKKNVRVFAGLGLYGVQNFTYTEIQNLPPNPSNPFPTDSFNKKNNDLNVQFNLGVSKLFKSGYNVALAFGYYHERFTSESVYQYYRLTTNNYVSSAVSLSRRFKYFEPIVMVSAFDVLNLGGIQAEAGITLFPFKKNRFYNYTSFGYTSHSNYLNKFWLFKEKMGYGLKNGNQLEAFMLVGALDNYMGNLGFVTYNTFDPINYLVSVQFAIKKNKINIIPGYQLQNRDSYYTVGWVSGGEGGGVQIVDYTYYSHLFYLTLRYTP